MTSRSEESIMIETMKDNTITYAAAWAFSCFLYAVLVKRLLLDNGLEFNDIFLIAITFCIVLFLEDRFFEGRMQIVFILLFFLYDKGVHLGNLTLLLGLACIREQFDNFLLKTTVTFSCGCIFLLVGWLNVGKFVVIHSLILYLLNTIGFLLWSFWYKVAQIIIRQFWESINRDFKTENK